VFTLHEWGKAHLEAAMYFHPSLAPTTPVLTGIPPAFPQATPMPPAIFPSLPFSISAQPDSFALQTRPVSPLPIQPGLSQPAKIFKLSLLPNASYAPIGQAGWLTFQVNRSGTSLAPNLKIVHEKPAHIFIVTQDLSDFQHVHPEQIEQGRFRIPIHFKAPGLYKLFTQFTTPEDGEQTLSQTFRLGTLSPPLKPVMPDATMEKTIDGITFQVTGLPLYANQKGMFHIGAFKNGMPVGNIQPYLGAGAHGVILSQDLNSFIHTHPMSKPQNDLYQSPIMFHANIEKPGLYKMWVQTQIDNKIRTVDWTFRVQPSPPGG
jgi:hypothetical protein